MCLLVVVSRLDRGTPLVVGANRDERLERPATAMTVLRETGPRILGGRDEEAGGTWLAVNEHGVVAGLTNRPAPEGRDLSKRSRGELPLALAGHRDAASAVEAFVARFRVADYNPSWLLVGDRTSLYAVDMTGASAGSAGAGAGDGRPVVEELGPGVHILENNPLHTGSPKEVHVRRLLGDLSALEGADLIERVRSVLVDHTIPETEAAGGTAKGAAGGDAGGVRAHRHLRHAVVHVGECPGGFRRVSEGPRGRRTPVHVALRRRHEAFRVLTCRSAERVPDAGPANQHRMPAHGLSPGADGGAGQELLGVPTLPGLLLLGLLLVLGRPLLLEAPARLLRFSGRS